MSTTTIRLPDELRARVAAVAAAQGASVHAFMVVVIAAETGRLERRLAFHAEAQARLQEMQETGLYCTHEDLRDDAQALACDEAPERPPLRQTDADELKRFCASLARRG